MTDSAHNSDDKAGPGRNQRRGHGRVTLTDVARIAGVTSITVSRYLREPHRLAPETADRVRRALADTAYVPHKQAGHLASGQSSMVAALIPNIGHSIFGETVQSLAELLQPAGYELLIAATGYSLEREEEQLRAVLGWLPAAVLVTGRQHSAGCTALLARARDSGVPVIEMWDHQRQRHPFAQVGFSHAAVGQAMAQHLIERGHSQLSYVDTPVTEDVRAHERADAFLREARRAGVPAHLLRTTATDAFDAGREALQKWHEAQTDAPQATRSPRKKAGDAGAGALREVTAMAFANDHLAAGALLHAQRIGLDVPGRMALLGFGDFPIARQLDPPLSTVCLPRHEIGAEAARQVLAALRDGVPASSCPLRWEMMNRGTT